MEAANGTYHHIVVGVGSAGCVIARRLVDAGRKVLLTETGGCDDNPAIHDPGRSWERWNAPEDYAYLAEPQQHADGTQVFWPRGKVLGGSSDLNGMIYVRGHRSDYDDWAKRHGATGRSYDEVLPYFRRSEDFEDGPSHYHGTGGPLPVTRNRDPHPVTSAFIETACRGRDQGPEGCGRRARRFCQVEASLRKSWSGSRYTAWLSLAELRSAAAVWIIPGAVTDGFGEHV